MIKAQGEMTLGAAWCFQEVSPPEPWGVREGAGPGTGTDTDHGEGHPAARHQECGCRELRLSPCPPSGFRVFPFYIKTPRRTFYSRKTVPIQQTQTRPSKGFGVKGSASVERSADRALPEMGRAE